MRSHKPYTILTQVPLVELGQVEALAFTSVLTIELANVLSIQTPLIPAKRSAKDTAPSTCPPVSWQPQELLFDGRGVNPMLRESIISHDVTKLYRLT